LLETIIALIVVAVSVVTTLKYRNRFKKYKQLYEEETKKRQPNTRPHMSPKAIQTRIDLQHYLEIRSQVLLRDNFRCQECNFYKHLEVHHIVPRSKGGTDDPSNLVTLCQRCHAKKHGFAHRENKRKRHTKRNHRKHFKRYINKHTDFVRETRIPIKSMEDVHPRQEDHSPQAEDRRAKLYAKWQNNELNQTNKKQDVHE
jgi:5-methylcytosine-specific restriction endonuclease McrA